MVERRALDRIAVGRSRGVAVAFAAFAGVGVAGALCAAEANAGGLVSGKNGMEIEGPRDRRGFYFGGKLGGGALVAPGALFPDVRLGVRMGGGVTKRLTLGLNLYLGKLSGSELDAGRGWHGGANLELNAFLNDGFFLRATGGVTGVPRDAASPEIDIGVGGSGGLGYEFFLGTTAAMGVSLEYDLRVTPQVELRHGPMLGVSFSWY